MQTIQIPPKVIDALENAIITAIENRIENDPDVADTYLRIIAQDGKFTVKVMYLEESNATAPNDDIALLNLMFDRKDNVGSGTEDWTPDPAAIRELAESYSEMIAVYINPQSKLKILGKFMLGESNSCSSLFLPLWRLQLIQKFLLTLQSTKNNLNLIMTSH